MRLDEIAVERDAFDQAMEQNGGELTEELAQQFDFLNLAEADKVDRYIFVVRSLEGEAASQDGIRAYYQSLADGYAKQRDSRLNQVKWLKRRVLDYMVGRGLRVLKGLDLPGFRVQKNGGRAPIEVLVEPRDLPPAYQRVEPNLERIRDGLLSGAITPTLARFGECGQQVRII